MSTFLDTTVAGNYAGADGGGVVNDGVAADSYLYNTIVADNTTTGYGPDLNGDFEASFTLIDNDSNANVTEVIANSNITGVDPQLGPLADNGGFTQTRALAATSPAIDQGAASISSVDQRYLPRPFDFASIANSSALGADGSDMGAFELQGSAPPSGGGGGGGAAAITPPRCKGKTATIFARTGLARTFTGTNKRDVIVGTKRKDRINARGGNDLVCAKGGKDTVLGKGGKDKLFGQGGNDTLKGGGGKDVLKGGGGKDKLFGGGGNDKLVGGAKNDTCVGGPGKDVEKSC
jgi:Ca2+-binding RTX toxin-like protein